MKFAADQIDAARKHFHAVQTERYKENHVFREAFDKLYYTLAVLAGGTIALSINFLSSHPPLTPHHREIIFTAWSLLFVCLVSSLGQGYFSAQYTFFAHALSSAKAHRRVLEAELTYRPQLPIQENELSDFLTRQRAAIQNAEETVSEQGKIASRYNWARTWCHRLGWVGYVGGVALLLWYAASRL